MPHKSDSPQSYLYEVRLQGHLNPNWQEWFDDMNISLEENGVSILTGEIADQAALFGLLKKVREIGIPLISVNRLSANTKK